MTSSGESAFDAASDLNADGHIDNCDSDILAANWGLSGAASEKHYYYHYDGLGSVTAISDEGGTTIERYEYSVYGDVQILTAKENGETRAISIIDNPYYFTGRHLRDKNSYFSSQVFSTSQNVQFP